MQLKEEAPLGLISFSILFSLILHVLILWLGSFGLHKDAVQSKDEKKESVQWINLQENFLQRKIVDIADSSYVTSKDIQSDYLSDQNRLAPKQMRSRLPAQDLQASSPAKKPNSSNMLDENVLNLSDQALSDMLAQNQTPYSISFNPNNYLPEIEIGDQTMLSTKKFAYATYFNRMKRAIQVYWKPPLSLIQTNPHKKQWISQMLIIIDKEGNLSKQHIAQSSGIQGLDQFALRAVQQAAPFYNPPKVLLDESGEIRMTWHFIFESKRL